MRSLTSPGVLLLFCSACGRDPAVLRNDLMDADRAFARDVQARRLEGWVEAFADSALVLRPNVPVAVGKAAVRERIAAAFADTSFTLNWEPIRADVAASGDLGFTVGLSQSRRLDADGKPVVGTGKYTTIWRRQPDGSWKVVLDVGTPDAPR